MDSVLGYCRTFFIGGAYRPPQCATFEEQIAHFHEMLEDLVRRLDAGEELRGVTAAAVLQGPFSDAMTHAGQIAMLRRLAGSPVPPENFIRANISAANVGPNQPLPVSPDAEWPEKP